jgi:anti-sigma-K factor RskA
MNPDRGDAPAADDHQAFDELAVGWALHALEPEDDAAFAAHLPGCARCADTVADTRAAMAVMAAELPAAEPSEELRHRLRAAVEATDQAPLPTADGGRPTPAPRAGGHVQTPTARPRVPVARSGRARIVSRALAAAALAAIVGVGVWNVGLASERRHLESTLAQQSAVMDALVDPDRATLAPLGGDGQPVATVVPGEGEIEVVTHGLAVNDAAHTIYVVWGLHGDVPVPLGTFDVKGPQMTLQTVGSASTGAEQYDQYAVSLEPGRKAPSAPTDVVATGQVTS